MGQKINPMLAKIEEKYRREYEEKYAIALANFRIQVDMAMQISADAALMAVDDTFDVTEESAEQFHLAHIDNVNAIAKLTIEDSEVDPEFVYTKEDVDRRLLQIVGKKNFVPWDERHKVRVKI